MAEPRFLRVVDHPLNSLTETMAQNGTDYSGWSHLINIMVLNALTQRLRRTEIINRGFAPF